MAKALVGRSVLAVLGLYGISSAPQAYAQAQGPATGAGAATGQLEEIVVTARRTEEKQQVTPVAVTAITAAAIERLNTQSATQLSQVIPNFVLSQGSGGPTNVAISIRGIGNQEPLLTVDEIITPLDGNCTVFARYVEPAFATQVILTAQLTRLYEREDWSTNANWKTMLENYLECYHCAVAHPGFSAAIDVMPQNYHLKVHGWFASQIGRVRQSAIAGKSAVNIYDARGEVAQAQYHLLWPNMTININPGFPNLSIDIWIPDGPNRTLGFSEQYFGPGVSETFARELIAFNKQVGYEDDAVYAAQDQFEFRLERMTAIEKMAEAEPREAP